MPRFLLDTTVLIDLSKGIPGVRDRLDDLLDAGGDIGVCAVSVAEFLAGTPPSRRERWGRRLDEFRYWDTSRAAAELAGELCHDLARRGRTLHIPDALVAGVALSLDAVVLTDNHKHFAPTGVRTLGIRR